MTWGIAFTWFVFVLWLVVIYLLTVAEKGRAWFGEDEGTTFVLDNKVLWFDIYRCVRCGNRMQIRGTPKSQELHYCAKCGRRITEFRYQKEESE
jgi:DNA-directed RNA polymerase subunit RPC12/RpoP